MTLAQKTPETTGPPLPPTGLSLQEAVSFLRRQPKESASSESWLSPLLEQAERAESWYVASRHNAPEGSYSLQVFVWPAGAWTKVHDHSSWGALRCVAGSIVEERYKRLDDGSRPEHARLEKIWRREWTKGRNEISTVLPYEGGIHRVGNPGDETAVSVHLYGPRMGVVDGRDYEPSRDYVCDRWDD